MRARAPIRLSKLYTVPGSTPLAQHLIQAATFRLRCRPSVLALCAKQSYESKHVGVFCRQRPIKPAGLIVLAIRVVVPELSAPHFVTHQNHRQAQREDRDGQEVFHLAISKFLHSRVIGWTLNAPVVASVVVCAIAVVFTVRLVVLLIVGAEVVQREAVVAGHEIHACFGLAFLVSIDLRASEQPVGHDPDKALIAAEKATYVIAKATVPLAPSVAREATHLVLARRIPCFGDQLRTGERRI